jgi:ankyrin repeat protein
MKNTILQLKITKIVVLVVVMGGAAQDLFGDVAQKTMEALASTIGDAHQSDAVSTIEKDVEAKLVYKKAGLGGGGKSCPIADLSDVQKINLINKAIINNKRNIAFGLAATLSQELYAATELITMNTILWTAINNINDLALDNEDLADFVANLLSRGASLKVLEAGEAPIHLIVEKGLNNLLRSLYLNQSAKIAEAMNVQDSSGKTSLDIATANNNTDAIELLAATQEPKQGPENTGVKDIENMIKTEEPTPENIALLTPVINDPINSSGETCLHIAARHGKVNWVNALLNQLDEAQKQGLLFKRDSNDNIALHLAPNADVLEALILPTRLPGWLWGVYSSPTDYINAENNQGLTPLMKAAELGAADAIKKLTDEDADRNKIDKNGQTALHIAAKNGHAAAVRALHTGVYGSSYFIAMVDNDGNTALHLARKGDVVDELLKYRGSATWGGTYDLFKILNHNGQTAFACAAATLMLLGNFLEKRLSNGKINWLKRKKMKIRLS